ncbi:lysozyme family protein, partial [Anaerorhabdus sp.]|uniref:lysozyme family protein n=1 Tax=Anaerorhabdus sp. TaxID=1872524 RepID=UPI002FCA0480
KSIDKVAIAGERIRNITTKTKEHIEESSDSQYATPHDYASSKITSHGEHFVNKTAIEAKVQSQKIFRYVKERKRKAEDKALTKDETKTENVNTNTSEESSKKIKTKEHVDKDIKTTDRNSKMISKSVENKVIKVSEKNGKTIKKTTRVSIKTSQEAAKQAAIKSAKVSKGKRQVTKELGCKSFSAVKKTAHAVKRAIEATRAAFAFLCSIGWIAILIILLIALIGGVFMSSSSSNGEGNQLSNEVIAHTATIRKYADEYEIPHFINALQAIMMQESGGRGTDPMQASECPHNKKYPNIPNGITDAEYSIQVGVQNFADCLKQANCTDALEISSLSLAMQGYNFGNGYINWALKNFGAYSQANAKVFSDEQAQKHGWSSYGDSEYVSHVMRYYQFAGLGTSNSKLVNVATSQLGNVGGAPYWSWYGYNERVEWCACFVSWVAYQSGDLNVTIPKFAAVVDGVKWYRDRGQWKDRNYIPVAGTIIFFDWENDGTPDHVGIVEKVEDGIVYAIEGNSNDECKKNIYTFRSIVIYGYGILN